MTKVKVLIEGYAKQINNGWLASSTVTLIESNGKKIVIDPGCNKTKLLNELSKNNLTPSDIDFVLLTHNHTDHVLLTAIFEKAKVLNDTEIYDDDNQIEHGGVIPGTDLKIIGTPGHDQFHCAVVAEDENLGKVVVAGDVFWWRDDEEKKIDYESLLNHPDPYVKNDQELLTSRRKILDIANYVIPGHGKMFKVNSK